MPKPVMILVAAAVALGACSGPPRESARQLPGGSEVSTYSHLADTVIRLIEGDSVELQAVGEAVIPGQPAGMLVTYHAFRPIEDTIGIRLTALALFDEVRARADSSRVPFVVLRAVDRRAAERTGIYQLRSFGVVLSRQPDGQWREQ